MTKKDSKRNAQVVQLEEESKTLTKDYFYLGVKDNKLQVARSKEEIDGLSLGKDESMDDSQSRLHPSVKKIRGQRKFETSKNLSMYKQFSETSSQANITHLINQARKISLNNVTS